GVLVACEQAGDARGMSCRGRWISRRLLQDFPRYTDQFHALRVGIRVRPTLYDLQRSPSEAAHSRFEIASAGRTSLAQHSHPSIRRSRLEEPERKRGHANKGRCSSREPPGLECFDVMRGLRDTRIFFPWILAVVFGRIG